jgi:Xaa-Pro dipeptidase
MDVPPMIYSGNPLIMTPGMVFFVHIMIPDATTGLTAGVGQTFAITENGYPEVFSDLPVQLYCVERRTNDIHDRNQGCLRHCRDAVP